MSGDLQSLNLAGDDPRDATTPGERALAAGLLAGAAALAASAVPRALFGTPFIPERVIELLFAVMPIAVVTPVVAILGPYAKRFAFVAAVLGTLVIFAWIGRAFAARRPAPTPREGLLFGTAVWLVASATLVPALGGGAFGVAWRPHPAAAAGALLALGLVFGGSFAALLGALSRDERLARRAARLAGRRAVLQSILASGVAAVAFESVKSFADFLGFGDDSRVRGGSGEFPDVDGLAREVTPTGSFYTVSKNVFDPEPPPGGWALEIAGLVDRPRRYTLADLRAAPAAEAFATLMCIDNPVGGDLIGNAIWRGVPLAALLAEAGVGPGAVDVVFAAFDDYTDSVPVERALRPGALLAYEMNGAPLAAAHGAPLRAVVPGIYGMKNVKWLRRVEVVSGDVKGYWQRRGWDDRAEYQTTSRIDVARAAGPGLPAAIAGVAFAGDRGVSRVEVSTDGGRTWADAVVRPPLSDNAWALWHFPWTPPAAGSYRIVARATDGLGARQTADRRPAAPSGATGLHGVTLRV